MTDVLATIRSRGYWEVVVHPQHFDAKLISSLSEVERVARDAHVQLRGWDYPHMSREGTTRHSDYIEGTVSWESYHELWRLYQSGQFVHLFAMREDWWAENSFSTVKPANGSALSYASTLYTLTEIFLFAARLAEATSIASDMSCRYRLVGLSDRKLMTFDNDRAPFAPWHKAATDLAEYGEEVVVPASRLIGNSHELAVDQAIAVFERLNWSAPRDMLVEDQRRFLERRVR